MLKDAIQFQSIKPVGLKRLGIDEISLRKGKGDYCAVLIDLDKSELITILPGRTQEDIQEILLGWGDEILKQIEEVSRDLWKSYKSLILKLIPNAQIVADRFHVMKQINQELDVQRKKENSELKQSIKKERNCSRKDRKCQNLEAIKKSKYVLLKNEESLNES